MDSVEEIKPWRHRKTIEDQFIINTAEKLGISEDIVDRVASFQWKSIKDATLTESVIEISGMARLQIRPIKLKANIKAFNNFLASAKAELETLDKEKDERWYSVHKKVKGLEKDVEFLNNKKVV